MWNINVYGAVLNKHCRFYVFDIGQSTTLTGRCIAKHMSAYVNQSLAGEYDHTGKSIVYGDTDSEFAETIHKTNWGELTVEELFNRGQRYWNDAKDDTKEYSANDDLKVLSYNPEEGKAYYGHINYIYRHKVSKEQWEIEDQYGNTIRVTGDHSVMVERDGVLMEIKPRDILKDDLLITSETNICYQ